jgi:hypothetical protein
MRRAAATVVALVGRDTDAALTALDRAANVHTVEPTRDGSDLDRAVEAWETAARVHAPYAVHTADPLEAVANAWVRLYEQTGPVGEVEVAVQATRQRHRAGTIELPDYYLVLDAESLAPTRRHWYLGVLHRHAPARVLPVAPSAEALVGALAGLSAGRWWPGLDEMIDGVERVAPDVDYSSSEESSPEDAGPGGSSHAERSRPISF